MLAAHSHDLILNCGQKGTLQAVLSPVAEANHPVAWAGSKVLGKDAKRTIFLLNHARLGHLAIVSKDIDHLDILQMFAGLRESFKNACSSLTTVATKIASDDTDFQESGIVELTPKVRK